MSVAFSTRPDVANFTVRGARAVGGQIVGTVNAWGADLHVELAAVPTTVLLQVDVTCAGRDATLSDEITVPRTGDATVRGAQDPQE